MKSYALFAVVFSSLSLCMDEKPNRAELLARLKGQRSAMKSQRSKGNTVVVTPKRVGDENMKEAMQKADHMYKVTTLMNVSKELLP